MDRNDAPSAAEFALAILRRHPQISYEHAVSAAEYAGIDDLPRALFLATAERLGIHRDPAETTPAPAAPAAQATTGSPLVERLDAFQDEVRQSAEIRTALLKMQAVVRAALAGDEESSDRG